MKIYDVRDFGAVADGKTVTTKALQAAIDACAAEGVEPSRCRAVPLRT